MVIEQSADLGEVGIGGLAALLLNLLSHRWMTRKHVEDLAMLVCQRFLIPEWC